MAAVEIAVRAVPEAFKHPVGRPNGRLMESWTGPRMEQAAPFVNPTISIFGAADSDWNLFCLQRHLSAFFYSEKKRAPPWPCFLANAKSSTRPPAATVEPSIDPLSVQDVHVIHRNRT